jgi:hypothetical protein
MPWDRSGSGVSSSHAAEQRAGSILACAPRAGASRGRRAGSALRTSAPGPGLRSPRSPPTHCRSASATSNSRSATPRSRARSSRADRPAPPPGARRSSRRPAHCANASNPSTTERSPPQGSRSPATWPPIMPAPSPAPVRRTIRDARVRGAVRRGARQQRYRRGASPAPARDVRRRPDDQPKARPLATARRDDLGTVDGAPRTQRARHASTAASNLSNACKSPEALSGTRTLEPLRAISAQEAAAGFR